MAATSSRTRTRSRRRKSSPLACAISMLTFYINRAGRNLPKATKSHLQRAKDILRNENARQKAR